MAATTLGFIPLQLIQTNALNHYSFDKGFPANGTYVVVKTPTVAQQLQLTKSLKDMQSGKEINNNNDISNKPVILRCKRRVDFTGLGCKLVDSHNPSVSRRNERERKRVKMVNMGFETLRQHVPSGRKNKKMSKVETLRSAVQYIKQLQDMLDAGDTDVGLDGVNLDELQSKVSEMIKNSNMANNNGNNLDLDNDMDSGNSSANSDITVNNINNINYHHQQQSTEIQQQHQLDNLHQQQQQFQQQQSPEPSPGLPESPITSQDQHFFTYHQNSQIFSSGHFANSSSMYAQGSPVGSLHSPTSSVVSDSSYDSIGETASPDDDDILSGISSWF